MRRQLNYTGRRKLPLTCINIAVAKDSSGQRRFDAELSLTELKLSADAQVFVEAYYERSLMRFDFGSVGSPITPSDRFLGEIDSGDQVSFRIKVVEGVGASARIAATADGIRVGVEEGKQVGRKPILPVSFTDKLGELVWRVHFEDLTGPVLEVNTDVNGIMQMVRQDRMFFALVYPAVVKAVYQHILFTQELLPDDVEKNSWQGDWMSFAKTFYRDEFPNADSTQEELTEWCNEVAISFARFYRAVTCLNDYLKEGEPNAS